MPPGGPSFVPSALPGAVPAPRNPSLAPAGQNARRQAFLQRRTSAFRTVEQAVNSGQMSQEDAHAQLQRQGFVPGGTAYKKPPGWMKPGLQTIADVAQTVHDVPIGMYQSAKAVGLDTRDYLQARPGSQRAPFSRTRALGGSVVSSLVQDFQHPLRHPGNTALDLAVGVGGVAKLGRLAARLPEDVPAAIAKVRADPRALRQPASLLPGGPPVRPRRPPMKWSSSSDVLQVGQDLGRMYGKTAKLAGRVAVPYGKRPYTNLALTRLESSRERNLRANQLAARRSASQLQSSALQSSAWMR